MAGGYFTCGNGLVADTVKTSVVGGQGGNPCYPGGTDELNWYKDYCGAGGNSGAGGYIQYSKQDNIFAFNGDMITIEDYTTTYYEYDKDGVQTNTVLNIYERKNLNGNTIKFIPTKIFSQSGIIRKTYTTNQGEFTLSKVIRKLNENEKLPDIAKKASEVVAVLATEETKTAVTGYTNPLTPELKNQGIGSRSPDI